MFKIDLAGIRQLRKPVSGCVKLQYPVIGRLLSLSLVSGRYRLKTDYGVGFCLSQGGHACLCAAMRDKLSPIAVINKESTFKVSLSSTSSAMAMATVEAM